MCDSVTGKAVVIGGRLGSTDTSVSCAVEETRGGEVAKALAFSVMAPSAWYGCVALHSLVLCTMHQRPLNMVSLFTCVLMLGCLDQENSNFRYCVSVERLFIGFFSLAA